METGSNGSEKEDSNQLYIQHSKLEATTDRHDSSEEDHFDSHDQSTEVQSQSLDPISPTSPSTAAAINDSSKNPGYYSDYLKRLPRQERRRIQREIQKEHKPGES